MDAIGTFFTSSGFATIGGQMKHVYNIWLLLTLLTALAIAFLNLQGGHVDIDRLQMIKGKRMIPVAFEIVDPKTFEEMWNGRNSGR